MNYNALKPKDLITLWAATDFDGAIFLYACEPEFSERTRRWTIKTKNEGFPTIRMAEKPKEIKDKPEPAMVQMTYEQWLAIKRKYLE